MKRYNTCKTAACKSVHIEGTSMTIPGLAPDLQTLLAAAVEGEPLPRVGNPCFDETPEAGIARSGVADLPPEELLFAYQIAQAQPAQPGEEPEPSASPNESEAPSEAQE